MNNSIENQIGKEIIEYCKKFNVPLDFLFEILGDQKVTPMIRGKAMEYNAYLLLENNLAKTSWSVQKLNLNAQLGTYDEDISITHRRTGIILKVESKSAVRGSMTTGKRSRIMPEPHFKVKCHRSRSNIKLANTSNDRYSIDSFDLLITNPSNAIFQGNTVGETLEIIYNEEIKSLLFKHYKTDNEIDLKERTENDWCFAIPKDIAVEGYIPRTPYVKLKNDRNWFKLNNLEEKLLSVIEEKRKEINQNSRRT